MKQKILTLLAAGAVTLSISAQMTLPEFYSENFSSQSEMKFVGDGWTTYGVDGTVVDVLSSRFPASDPDRNAYAIVDTGNAIIPMCATNFVPPKEADEWLVSPEINVPEDADSSVLSFNVSVLTSQTLGIGTNPFKVYVSTTGTDKEDFEVVYEGSLRGSQTAELNTKLFCIPVNGYAGKTVHLAFVANGKDVGMTGFSDIKWGSYYADFVNYTPAVGEIGNKYNLRVNYKLKAPVSCPNITTIVYVNDIKVSEQEYKKEFGGRSTSPTLQLIQVENLFDIQNNDAISYRLEVTPGYEGAPVSVLTGVIGVPEYDYPNNVVIEECTASSCGWCPRGTASLAYYHDTYPGSETQGKAIGIAVHGSMNWYDPMSAGVSTYLQKIYALNSTTGLPQAIFNRATTGLDPTNKTALENQIAKRSYNQVTITGVETPAIEPGEYMNGKEITVKYEARNGYSANGLDLRAAVVLIENNVKGNTDGYNQSNYFYNKSESYVVSSYGEWLLPYLKDYVSGGSLGQETVSFDKVTYQHVARGIWPEFTGKKMTSDWVANVPVADDITLTVPDNVIDWNNVEAIVLLIDNKTNQIVGSDIMPSSEFNNNNAVAVVADDNASIICNGDVVTVKAAAGDKVSVYAVDGTLLGQYVAGNDAMTINATAWSGLVIVKVEGNGASLVKKFIF